MRFPARLLLAGSVLTTFAASTATAVLMTDRPDYVPVDYPSTLPTPPTPTGAPPAPPPAETPLEGGPPVTGRQVAELGTSIAPAPVEPFDGTGYTFDWQRYPPSLREEVRLACERGHLDDPLCDGA